MVHRIAVAMIVLILPISLACEQPSGEPSSGASERDTAAQDMDAQETPSAPPARLIQSPLRPLNDGDVGGRVEFFREDDMLSVSLRAANLSPGEHASHIHAGTCEEPGDVVTPLNPPTAEGQDTTGVESEVNADELRAGEPYLVMVHGSQGAPVACAEVPQGILGGSRQESVR